MENEKTIDIVGAGLAGSEAAWQLADRGAKVRLFEMKPKKFSPAHKSAGFAELVCSNSLRSDDPGRNAVGLLHEEMRRSGSLVMQAADATRVPAGGALAVDRAGFSDYITEKLKNNENIEVINEEVTELPQSRRTIIAAGPLASDALAADIAQKIGRETLGFYDAIAPVVYTDSIDFSKAWHQSRYDKGDAKDYINCPLDRRQYDAFVDALLAAEKMPFRDFENERDARYFDGCLPIEVMAERGRDTLAFGPMKPVGLTNPHNPGAKPCAVVQLRQDNKEDTLRNIVGFQTKLKYPEQERIFRAIPGLENAKFARLGGIHRNTFVKSPILLDPFLRLKSMPHVSFAGQITGCEGYVESAAVGLLAGRFAAEELQGSTPVLPPRETAFGSLLAHLRNDTDIANYQPMNITFGLFPPLEGKAKKSARKEAYAARALEKLQNWL